jgi:predicted O-linked N-acetylglucosamine transferase (SPINDLY family)/predicted SAM-dependent methyltransferase
LTSLQKALQIDPELPAAIALLGEILHTHGKPDEAERLFRKVLRSRPDSPEIWNNLGLALHAQQRFQESIQPFQEAIQRRPDFAEAHNNLGNAYKDIGNTESAEACYSKAISKNPRYAVAHYNLGTLFLIQGDMKRAVSCFRDALKQDPNLVEAQNNLGNAYKRTGRLTDAEQCFLEALRIKPNFPKALSSLGNAYKDQGRMEKALEHYKRAIAVQSNYHEAHSNLLLALNYLETAKPAGVFHEHLRWSEQHAAPMARFIEPHPHDPRPDRILRIGYVSPDFRRHSVAFFLEGILAAHNRTAFEVVCFSDVQNPDSVTDRLKALSDKWIPIHGLSDESVDQRIRQEEIDLLVDLAGHTGNNRLLVFARKPSPVQLTYLGYPNTTGLSTMDYRITDPYADPVDGSESFFSEELLRLPHTFLCYRPPQNSPEVGRLPGPTKGPITFGSFNNLSKLTPQVISLWSRILKGLPHARLILKSRALSDTVTSQRLIKRFTRHGVHADQIQAIGFLPSFEEHLQRYHDIDIGLDPFPYNGTTTTCEALWMGVPVITMAGDRHASRVGLSLLSNAGLGDLVARSEDEYLQKAINLAGDTDRLSRLRADLRSRVSRSPLMDENQFARALESLYRKIWHRWTAAPALHFDGFPPSRPRKLHIGGTAHHPDWEVLNIQAGDHVDHVGDARNLSRFDDGTFSEIYASHVLEHFDYVGEMDAVLEEWHRVLKPGGRIFISVPDLDTLADLFLMKDRLDLQDRFHVMRMIFGGHTSPHDYHKVGLNAEILQSFLRKAGFINLRRVDNLGIFQDTSTLQFHGRPVSLNMVAEKPTEPAEQDRNVL